MGLTVGFSFADIAAGTWPPDQAKQESAAAAANLERARATIDRDYGCHAADTFVSTFERATSKWTASQRISLLQWVRDIANAEHLRVAPRGRKVAPGPSSLAREAIAAAKLANDLWRRFPEPTDAIRELIRSSAEFAVAVYRESMSAELAFAAGDAYAQAKSARGVSIAALVALVDLSLGGGLFNESALCRRYAGHGSKRSLDRLAKIWQPERKLLRSAEKLLSALKPVDEWARAYSGYLSQPESMAESLSRSLRLSQNNSSTVQNREPTRGHRRPSGDVQPARALRAALTRSLQAARNEDAFGLAIVTAVEEQLSDWPKDRRTAFLQEGLWGGRRPSIQELKRKPPKASDLAARISAAKYGIALRVVRSGRVEHPLPRLQQRSRVVPVESLTALEHALERRRRGGSSRH
jgi:hypothetical protein